MGGFNSFPLPRVATPSAEQGTGRFRQPCGFSGYLDCVEAVGVITELDSNFTIELVRAVMCHAKLEACQIGRRPFWALRENVEDVDLRFDDCR